MQSNIKDLPDRGDEKPHRRQGRKYYVPYFVRGIVKVRKSSGFSAFLHHHGLSETLVVSGFQKAHRALSGLLNKKSLLFQKDVFRTYLHCMKRAYKLPLSETEKFRNLLVRNQRFEHRVNPWHRLILLLEGKAVFPGPDDIVIERKETVGHTSVRNPLLIRSALSNGRLVFHPEDVELLERDGNLYQFAYSYYGGPVKPGGVFFRQQVPYSQDPSLYHRDEDIQKGADDLMGLAALLRRNHPVKSYGGSVSGPTGFKLNSIAVRDRNGQDQIYDLVGAIGQPEELRIRPRAGFLWGTSRTMKTHLR
jgi:hypothetical protein